MINSSNSSSSYPVYYIHAFYDFKSNFFRYKSISKELFDIFEYENNFIQEKNSNSKSLFSDVINKQIVYPKFAFILTSSLLHPNILFHEYIIITNSITNTKSYFLITCINNSWLTFKSDVIDNNNFYTILLFPLNNDILYKLDNTDNVNSNSNVNYSTDIVLKVNTIFDTLFNNTRDSLSLTSKITLIDEKVEDIYSNFISKDLVVKDDLNVSFFISLFGIKNILISVFIFFLFEITFAETFIRPNYNKFINRLYQIILNEDE